MDPDASARKEPPMTSATATTRADATTHTRAVTLPWFVAAALLAATSAKVGVIWDISWHRSIGRDTFWTPAHMAIYLGGVLAGTACGWLALRTTFSGVGAERHAGVRFWGFRAPLGAWVCIWGALAMITSGPFDNWWHNAYGLDVKILSPPHILLALGMTGIRFGTLVMVLAEVNRAIGDYRVRLERVLYFCFAFLLGMTVGIMQEDTLRILMHGAKFYLVIMCAMPIWFAA